MITSAFLSGYAVVYAVSVFGLLSKLKWAAPLVIAVSVVNRALALGVIFEPNVALLNLVSMETRHNSFSFLSLAQNVIQLLDSLSCDRCLDG